MSAPNPSVRVTRKFKASPERVFDAWVNPEQVARWMIAPSAAMLPEPDTLLRCEVDPRVGGKFSFLVRRGGQELDHFGEYLEFDRPRRLAFTWGVAGFAGEASIVRIDLAPADGGTELTLVHERVLPDYAERTAQGWGLILGGIARSLGE